MHRLHLLLVYAAMSILLVCGGRKYRLSQLDAALLGAIHRGPIESPLGLFRDLHRRACAALGASRLPPIDHLFHGGAPGADKGAAWVAGRLGLPGTEFPADWIEHGRSAGPIRNRQMAKGEHPAWGAIGVPALAVAFPGGHGTADMIDVARKAGIPVLDLAGEHRDLLTPHQRWTRDDASLIRAGGPEAIASVRAKRPGVGPPIASGHWLKSRGEVCLSPDCEYIGRDAHGLGGHPFFANPFPVRPAGRDRPGRVVVRLPRGDTAGTYDWLEMSEAEALAPFADHLDGLLMSARGPTTRAELLRIWQQRKVLVCWCGSSKPCHATVVADRLVREVARAENRWLWSQVLPSPA